MMAGYDKKLPVAQQRYNVNRMGGEYLAVARALGAYGERIESPKEIVAALGRAVTEINQGRTAVLEFITKEDLTYPRTQAMDD